MPERGRADASRRGHGARAVGGLGLVSGIAAAALRPVRLIRAARVLQDIQAGDGESSLKRTTPAPVVRQVAFDVAGVVRSGDLYGPATATEAGIVLVPGAARLGKDDPRVRALATSFARAGIEVLVPEFPGFRGLRVCARDASVVSDGLVALSRHRAVCGSRKVGLVAVSYTVGPALLALLSPAAGAACHVVLAIGGYYDMEAAIAFFTTGCHRDPAEEDWRCRQPDPYAKWVFAISNAPFLDDPDDGAVLEAMARRRLDDPAADVSGLVAVLKGGGRAVRDLLENVDPDRVRGLIAALPPGVREQIAALSLKGRDLSVLHQKFIVVHGRDDPLLPESGSAELASALPSAELFLLGSLHHVDPGPAGLMDKLRMLAAMNAFLSEACRTTPAAPDIADSPFRPLATG